MPGTLQVAIGHSLSASGTFCRSGKPCQAGSSHEDAETDAESVESMGAEANLLMEEADRSLAPRKMENVLINMVSVQWVAL